MSTNSIMPANMSAIIARFLRRRKGCLSALVDLPSTAEGKIISCRKSLRGQGIFLQIHKIMVVRSCNISYNRYIELLSAAVWAADLKKMKGVHHHYDC